MIEKVRNIIDEYKTFIEKNSKYDVKVAKTNLLTSTHFPTITCIISNNTSTDKGSIDGIEDYEAFYISINIYAKNKTKGANIQVAAQVIIDELIDLTDYFFKAKNMKKTLNKPTPNIDQDILRQTMNFQCLVGNVRGNIIRR